MMHHRRIAPHLAKRLEMLDPMQVEDEALGTIKTVGDIVDYISRKL